MSTANSLARALEEMEGQRDAVEAMLALVLRANDEGLPWSMYMRLSSGENPVMVWREHRGLSRDDLAASVLMSESDLAAIEEGRVEPTLRVVAGIARALGVDMEHLVPCDQE